MHLWRTQIQAQSPDFVLHWVAYYLYPVANTVRPSVDTGEMITPAYKESTKKFDLRSWTTASEQKCLFATLRYVA